MSQKNRHPTAAFVRVAQAKKTGSQARSGVAPRSSRQQPAAMKVTYRAPAPPAYRPQPVPKVLQRKTTHNQLINRFAKANSPPGGPRVDRRRPTPGTLQLKTPGAQQPSASQLPLRAVAPPVYRPEHKKVAQLKASATPMVRTHHEPVHPKAFSPAGLKAHDARTKLKVRQTAPPAGRRVTNQRLSFPGSRSGTGSGAGIVQRAMSSEEWERYNATGLGEQAQEAHQAAFKVSYVTVAIAVIVDRETGETFKVAAANGQYKMGSAKYNKLADIRGVRALPGEMPGIDEGRDHAERNIAHWVSTMNKQKANKIPGRYAINSIAADKGICGPCQGELLSVQPSGVMIVFGDLRDEGKISKKEAALDAELEDQPRFS